MNAAKTQIIIHLKFYDTWEHHFDKGNLQVGPTHQTHQSTTSNMDLATCLPDTEDCGSTKVKYCQNIPKPHNHDMNLYTADALFAQDSENVLS